MSIREVLTAPRSPWRDAYADRLIGSIRQECLAHVLVFRQAGLRQTEKLTCGDDNSEPGGRSIWSLKIAR